MHEELSSALNFIISYLYNKLPRRRVDVFREELEVGFKRRFQGHWYPEEPSKGSGFRCVKLAGDKVDPVVDAAARSSGLDIAEIKSYLPTGLTLWIDPREVSYRVGEHGHLQVLFRKQSSATNSSLSTVDCGGSAPVDSDAVFGQSTSVSSLGVEVDQLLHPSSAAVGGWPGTAASCYDSQSASATGVSPSTGMRGFGAGIRPADLSPNRSSSWPPVACGGNGVTSPHQTAASTPTFTAATFAQTKFGSTKMKTHGPTRPSKLSPTSAAVASVAVPDGGMPAVTRLSPTGTPAAVTAGRWNLSPTAGAVGCLPSSPIGSAQGRLSPMQQATAAAAVGAASTYVHQLQAAAVAAASGVVDPRIEGLHDWLMQQQRAQRRDLQQQQQLQTFLRAAAAQQQQQQHLQQVRAAAAIMAANAFGSTAAPTSSPSMVGGHGMTSSSPSSSPQFGFQSNQQQPQYQFQMQQHYQRQNLPSSKNPSPAGYHDIMLMSGGSDSSTAVSGVVADPAVSHTAALVRDDVSSTSGLNMAQVDWSFDVGSLVSDSASGSESQASSGGYGTTQGLQHLLLAN